MKKVSLLLTHYNKNDCLPNTLYSIARQETTFTLDICFLDDHSDIDPRPIVKEFLPDAKYKRLDKNSGTQFSHRYCMDMADSDSDIFIILSIDVIITQKNGIEHICKNLTKNRVVFASVRNISVSTDLYKNFDRGIYEIISDEWNTAEVYSGIERSFHWYMFFSSIYREDLERINYRNNNCDVVIHFMLKKFGIFPIYTPSIIGIHQKHDSIIHPCKILYRCPHKCYRK